MAFRSRHRRVARLVIAALLFTQGTMAAHACKMALAAEMPAAMTVAAGVMVMADTSAMPGDCAEHHARAAAPDAQDPASSVDVQVCKAHCDQTQTTVGAKIQLDTSAMAASILPMPWLVAAPAAPAPAIAVPRNTGPPPGTPPLYIAYAVLRR